MVACVAVEGLTSYLARKPNMIAVSLPIDVWMRSIVSKHQVFSLSFQQDNEVVFMYVIKYVLVHTPGFDLTFFLLAGTSPVHARNRLNAAHLYNALARRSCQLAAE